MTDDLESLVRHAAEVVGHDGGPRWLRRHYEANSDSYMLAVYNWIREHVEGWLLERGYYCRKGRAYPGAEDVFIWFNSKGQQLGAQHESRTTAALLALKEATDA